MDDAYRLVVGFIGRLIVGAVVVVGLIVAAVYIDHYADVAIVWLQGRLLP
jgi:hypothetical protein